MRDTVQVVAHTRLMSHLRSKLQDAKRHLGRARTYRAKAGDVTVNGAFQGKQPGRKPEPSTVTLMLRGGKLGTNAGKKTTYCPATKRVLVEGL